MKCGRCGSNHYPRNSFNHGQPILNMADHLVGGLLSRSLPLTKDGGSKYQVYSLFI